MSEVQHLKTTFDPMKLDEIIANANEYDPILLSSVGGNVDLMELTSCSGTADFLVKVYGRNEFFKGALEIVVPRNDNGPELKGSRSATATESEKARTVDRDHSIKFSTDCRSELLQLKAKGLGVLASHYITVIKSGDDIAVLHGWASKFSMFKTLNDQGVPDNNRLFIENAEQQLQEFLTCGAKLEVSSLAGLIAAQPAPARRVPPVSRLKPSSASITGPALPAQDRSPAIPSAPRLDAWSAARVPPTLRLPPPLTGSSAPRLDASLSSESPPALSLPQPAISFPAVPSAPRLDALRSPISPPEFSLVLLPIVMPNAWEVVCRYKKLQ
ncbi:hypothetical protein [Duganella sp. BJB476]|uniref:hypothetical protein n=1 Tax=Duganella sp. BJB476 TaxID=1871176 RepID=UPI000E3577CE|nr:hypothetical protein [Duganella sp. BJB476]RFP28714.1 hypothetical protein D0T21_20505 [Duganella sp. BJB476]